LFRSRQRTPEHRRAIADFRKNANGVNIEAAVTDLRLTGVEFDARRYA